MSLKTKEPFIDSNSLKNFKKTNTPNIINLPNKNQDILSKNNLISNFCLSKPDKEFGQIFLFNNNHHQHKLAYLSRGKNWKCSLCNTIYSRENRSVSCTVCNYDLCLKCFK